MATETGDGPGEGPTGSTEDEFVEVEDDLEPESQGVFSSIRSSLGSAKDSYVDWHTTNAEEEADSWGEKRAAGTINRRGFLSGAAQLGAGAFLALEATDNDGWGVNLSEGQQPAGGGATPPPAGNETDEDQEAAATGAIDNPEQYAFETEQELIEETGFCYPQEADVYIGAVDASEVEDALDESGYNGDDPTGALNVDEVEMDLDDITAHQGLYAVDVDRKQGNDGDYDLFVQLVGQEDGGTYLTREGATEVSDMEFEEVFEGYHECN